MFSGAGHTSLCHPRNSQPKDPVYSLRRNPKAEYYALLQDFERLHRCFPQNALM